MTTNDDETVREMLEAFYVGSRDGQDPARGMRAALQVARRRVLEESQRAVLDAIGNVHSYDVMLFFEAAERCFRALATSPESTPRPQPTSERARVYAEVLRVAREHSLKGATATALLNALEDAFVHG